eukprot:Plantae.Rhodophyta-Rhodochaete_pulchella.ctg6823.p1 GENE.Plantae.Rhodophyta-Rhodochaete_pulchella.ctg6823~~Plantae.Rhodophyta-Rhodochaete_pulchella.ctg6823.p1  ORF type:complete len:269 (+),score=40.45 Plantae.Rhodophyta-Rhodochaete_pulchella.ctg6823:79-885(+)
MAGDAEAGPRVKETILKRRRESDRDKALRASARLLLRQRKKGQGKKAEELVKKAEKFVLEYRNKERFKTKARRGLLSQARLPVLRSDTSGSPDASSAETAKVLVVLRIRGDESIPQDVKSALRRWRLGTAFSAVFVERNERNLKTLRMVEPFVTYGYPTMRTVNELVYKRGFAKIKAGDEWTKKPLSDNRMIEESLGDHGIICTEDLIDEISSLGPNYVKAVKFLEPFRLRAPKDGMSKLEKLKPYKDGSGVYGNRGTEINSLLMQMV